MDSEEKIGKCGIPSCGKETQVTQCKYCGNYYCADHIRPKIPMGPISTPSSPEDRELRDDYKSRGGHPCGPFVRHIEEGPIKLVKTQKPAPEKTPAQDTKPAEPEYDPLKADLNESVRLEPETESEPQPEPKPKSHAKTVLIGIAILLLVIVSSQVILKDSLSPAPPPNCSDGTTGNTCSIDKPYFCMDGKLIQDASKCGCPRKYEPVGGKCVALCGDGSLDGECSYGKPLYCLNGSLIPKASLCGCPANYLVRGDACKENLACPDGTLYDECSLEKPLFCLNGVLINKSTACNCSEAQVSSGDECIPKYFSGQEERIMNYTIRGKTLGLKVTLYKGLDDYLAQLPRTYICDPACPTEQELQKRFLDEEKQKTELEKIVISIRASTRIKDDQARTAISLVQTIPYDTIGAAAENVTNRYPYEVIFENKGVCGEKSRLLAFLLRELGYEVVLLDYKEENHMAVGIKCPFRYSQYIIDNVSYCFIETTSQTIITDNKGEYAGAGKLTSTPTAHLINKGNSFDDVQEEWRDAGDWQALNKQADASNGKLIEVDYNKWTGLIKKYNMQITNQTQTNT